MYDEFENMSGEAAAFGDFEEWMKPVKADTKELALRRAILIALVEMGGIGQMRAVLKRVGELVEDHLTEDDYKKVEKLNQLKWENRACWVRADLVKEGLLKPKAKKGVWEISDLGRVALMGETS